LLHLHRSLDDGGPLLERQGLLQERLGTVVGRFAEGQARTQALPSDKPAVARARAYLHAHWDGDLSLDDLAVTAGASKCHLVRQFKDELGLPPHAYLIHLRVAKARTSLAAGRPVAEAAAVCGFAARSHLHRHFVRVYGLTPGQYRKATT